MDTGKKVMRIVSGVSAIVIGALLLVSGIINLFLLNDLAADYEIPSSVVIILLLIIALATALIVVSVKSLTSGLDSIVWDVALLILVGIVFILYVIGANDNVGSSIWASVLLIILSIISMVAKIAQLCIRSEPKQNVTQPSTYSFFQKTSGAGTGSQEKVKSSPTNQSSEVRGSVKTPVEKTVTEKIAELKQLKETGAIDEEQYKTAVDKIIQNI